MGRLSCLDKHILYLGAADVKKKLEMGFLRANLADLWQGRSGSGRRDGHVNKTQQRRKRTG